jgi:putative ABC transport system permease protein
MRAIHRKLIRDFFGLRSQVAATSILMVSGVALLIASWSAFQSLSQTREEYYRQYDFAEVFAGMKRAPLSLATRIRKIPGVRRVEPRIVIQGRVDLGFPATGTFLSIPSGAQPGLNRIYLRSGRLPIEKGQGEIELVVHEAFSGANRLHPGDSLSITIEGRRERARVVGIGLSPEFVAAISPSMPLPDDRHFGIFWMPVRDLERMAKMSGAFNQVAIALEPRSLSSPQSYSQLRREEVLLELDAVLKPYGGRSAQGRERQASDRFLSDEIEEQRGMALVAPAFFLGIAAFLVHTICSRLITRHRPQIATLKAMGYSHREVLLHYLGLTFLMMTGGVILGILAGAAFGRFYAWSYSGFFRFPEIRFRIDPAAMVAGCIAGVLPGILGGFSSVIAAYRLPAAEAMRPLQPPRFQAGLLERMPLESRLGPRGKMLWRSFFFRPWRFLFSTLGLAFAVAVVVMTSSWSDIVDTTLIRQFERIQREDVGVYFLNPQPPSSLRTFSTLPGVLHAEGRRVVPVRMRYLNHGRELLLSGRTEGQLLSADLDAQGRAVPLHEGGIRVSRYFERFWGMRQGDPVEFEILEGRPRSIWLRVAGFSDDPVGLHARIRERELQNALGEEAGYNAILLKTDPARQNEGLRLMKDFPAVGTVQLKTALYQGFQATIGSVMRTMSAILTGFALSIAVSITYNAVRVTFSERSWEAASLRVLGFSRSEVFGMLLGDLALQVFLAIFPGFWFGEWFSKLVIGTSNAETFGFQVVLQPETRARAALVLMGAFLISSIRAWMLLKQVHLADSLKVRD